MSMSTVNYCFTDFLSKMESSKLKFNVDKSYVIIIGTKQRNKIVEYFPIIILCNDTSSSETVQN